MASFPPSRVSHHARLARSLASASRPSRRAAPRACLCVPRRRSRAQHEKKLSRDQQEASEKEERRERKLQETARRAADDLIDDPQEGLWRAAMSRGGGGDGGATNVEPMVDALHVEEAALGGEDGGAE